MHVVHEHPLHARSQSFCKMFPAFSGIQIQVEDPGLRPLQRSLCAS